MTLASAIASYNTSECVKDYNGEILNYMLISTDLNVWAGREVVTVSDLEEWIDFQMSYSDTYKDANGFRPRHNTNEFTLSDWRKEFKHLRSSIEAEIAIESERKAISIRDFEALIATCIEGGAKDREEAIRWMFEAEETSVEFFLWDNGISYTDYGHEVEIILLAC